MKMKSLSFGLVASFLAYGFATAQDAPKTLDDFENIDVWNAAASDGVNATKTQINGKNAKGIRLDYDFNNRSGYAFIVRDLPLVFPQDYEVSFYIRGSGPKNNLEFKLKDKSGDNVWWKFTKDFEPKSEWQLVKFKKRHFTFAWGPIADKTLKETQSVEFVISAGAGGKGFIEIDDLKITPIAATNAPPPKPIVTTYSGDGNLAFDKNKKTAWQPTTDDKYQYVMLDLGRATEFGGLKLDWGVNGVPKEYEIAISLDKNDFQKIANVKNSDGGMDYFKIPEGDARYINIAIPNADKFVRLNEISIEPLSFGESDNNFIEAIAKDHKKGIFPRGFSGQQEFWTLIGADSAKDTGLISEDGAIEIGRGGFSITPFIVENGKTKTWNDVKITHSLEDDYLPIPSAKWNTAIWSLETKTWVGGNRDNSQLFAEYWLENKTKKPLKLKLALAIRPYQVNGPKQFLSTPGGHSPISSVAFDNGKVSVDNRIIVPMISPNVTAAVDFHGGELIERIDNLPQSQSAKDNGGYASGIMVYEVTLKPKSKQKFGLYSPLTGEDPVLLKYASDKFSQSHSDTANYWKEKLNRVEISLGGDGKKITNAIRTNLAYILMMKDGPMIRPGSRSYARSWIRDGAMIVEGFLRLGLYEESKEYLKWFTPYQFDNGKIPCCVDYRGSDPVAENDSHGEYIYMVRQIYEFTKDRALLESVWPNVKMAFEYMNNQRLSERTPKNQTPDRAHLYGLMPPSISHEGYSDKPAYSHWDNFWTLRGFQDAAELALIMDDDDDYLKYSNAYDEFKQDLSASLGLMKKKYGINYIPGAADRGDFDATSTTIALILGQEGLLDEKQLDATFDKYWSNFIRRRDKDKKWKDYTPYEWRVVSAFTVLGSPNRAEAASQFFMGDLVPKEWFAFAEVVGREKRTPRYLGDLPHGWVSSDFIRSSLDRIVYEVPESEFETDDGIICKLPAHLVIGEGIDLSWLEGDGIVVKNLHTTFGVISFTLKRKGNRIVYDQSSEIDAFVQAYTSSDIKKGLREVNSWAADCNDDKTY